MKKVKDILPYLLYAILCVGIGSGHIYTYIVFVVLIVLASIITNRRFIFPKSKFFLVLILFEITFSIGAILNKDFYITPAILPLLLYIAQFYIVTISKKISSEKMLASMAIGFSIHCLLNIVVNIDMTDRNLVDVWTGQVVAATSHALLLLFPLSFVTYALIFSQDRKYKFTAVIMLLIALAFSLRIGTRSIIIIFGGVFLLSLLSFFIKADNTTKMKIIMKISAVTLMMATIIGFNLFGVRDIIEDSNFYNRFTASDTAWSDGNRVQAFLSAPEILGQYPFGVERGDIKIGDINYIHNMWMDCWLQAGFAPAIILVIYFVMIFWIIVKRRKQVQMNDRILYAIVFMFCSLSFSIEPILKGNPIIFSIWVMFSCQMVLDARSNEVGENKTLRAYSLKKQRILWTTNVIMPYPARRLGVKAPVFGGWLIGLMKQIIKNGGYKLAIATVYGGKKFRRFDDGETIYYLLPCRDDTRYDSGLEYYWCKVIEDFRPALVHLHGTEFAHNLALQKACPDEKYLVSLQGLMGPISKKYLAGLSKKEIKKNRTFRDFVRGSILKDQKKFKKRSRYEAKILKNATAIVGRTEWDYNESLKIAGNKPYYKCNEILRDAFYDQNWNIREVEPHSIYVSQAGYPVKGFHILLEALPKLVEKYPDLKVYVAGPNILDRSTFRKRLLYSGYAKILENKIKKYGLEKNIIFIGEKTEAEVLECMKKSNVFVQCSVIENSSNSLGEAMLIGMPCVASDVGGTADLLDATKGEGLLYRFGDAKTLSELIGRVFDDFGLAIELGENAKKHAKIIYDKQKNTDTMLEIYEKVINL